MDCTAAIMSRRVEKLSEMECAMFLTAGKWKEELQITHCTREMPVILGFAVGNSFSIIREY
jgi:hypothetical protein